MTGDWEGEEEQGASLRSGLQAHRAWWGTQGPDTALLSSVVHPPTTTTTYTGFHSTLLPSSPSRGTIPFCQGLTLRVTVRR